MLLCVYKLSWLSVIVAALSLYGSDVFCIKFVPGMQVLGFGLDHEAEVLKLGIEGLVKSLALALGLALSLALKAQCKDRAKDLLKRTCLQVSQEMIEVIVKKQTKSFCELNNF